MKRAINHPDKAAQRGRADRRLVHPDGSICLEGTSRLPRRFRPCCEAFHFRTSTCVYDVRYEWWTKQKLWVIALHESTGAGGIHIGFCPHCGARLAGASQR